MSNTADVTGGKPIAVWSQSIPGLNAINPLVAFYDIHWRKKETVKKSLNIIIVVIIIIMLVLFMCVSRFWIELCWECEINALL
jgi:hypothetical protein